MLNHWSTYSKGDSSMQSYKPHSAGFKYIFVWTFFLVLIAGSMNAQPVKVKASLDTNNILIGDQIYLNLQVLQSKDIKVRFPNIQESLSPEIELLEEIKSDTSSATAEQIQIDRQYRITSFDSGRVEVPSLIFRYQADNLIDSVKTNPLALNVRRVKVDSAKTIFDIKGPQKAPISFRELLPYILGLIALAAIVFIVWYLIKRFKQGKSEHIPEKPSEPAHIIALRELDKLKEEKLWQNDQVKLYYTRLADILRTYLWHRYDIRTLERTTDEILDSLKNTDFNNDELFDKLENVLRTADLVKFARMHPMPDENDTNLNHAYEFVNQTKWVQEVQSEEQQEEDNDNANSNENEK
jgi:large-conductance mechanosensitive channel